MLPIENVYVCIVAAAAAVRISLCAVSLAVVADDRKFRCQTIRSAIVVVVVFNQASDRKINYRIVIVGPVVAVVIIAHKVPVDCDAALAATSVARASFRTDLRGILFI